MTPLDWKRIARLALLAYSDAQEAATARYTRAVGFAVSDALRTAASEIDRQLDAPADAPEAPEAVAIPGCLCPGCVAARAVT